MNASTQWLATLNSRLNECKSKTNGSDCSLEDAMTSIQSVFRKVREEGGTIYWIGNGGSLGACSHLAQDVLNKLKVASLALNDAPLITCMSNDFGYENVFQRPLETLLKKQDAIIAISSSGKSESILGPVRYCADKGIKAITLSAFDSANPLFALPAEVSIYMPTNLYGLAEVGHTALLHAAIETMWQEETGN